MKSNFRLKLLFAVCLVYVVAYWYRLLLQSMVPFDGNMLRLFYPSWMIGKRLLFDGCSVLWDPYRNMGQPFLADPQNQALYPLRILSLIFNFVDYERVFIIFHVLLAAGSAFALTKKIYDDDRAAFLCSVMMGFNGFFLAHVTLSSHFATMAWIPLTLLLLKEKKPVLLGIALTMEWLAGYPPFFILTGLLLIIFALIEIQRREALVCLGRGILIAAGLSAVQIIPFLELLKESNRALLLDPQQALEYSLHPVELLRGLALPSFVFKNFSATTNSDQAIVSFYCGPIFLLLFLLGALRGEKREKFLTIMTLVAFTLALGAHLNFYRHIPFITVFRFPAHWLLVAMMGFVLVGSSGLAKINNRNISTAFLVLIAADLLIYALPAHTAWGDITFISQAPLRLRGLESIPDGSRILHRPEVEEQVLHWKMNRGDDWLTMKGSLIPSIGSAYGIHEAESYSVLESKRHAAFLSRLSEAAPAPTLYNIAGISRIISADGAEFRVTENSEYKPRVFCDSMRPIEILTNHAGSIVVRAEGPGVVILSDIDFPGWRAWSDEREKSVELYEDTFPSIRIEPGNHVVSFIYRPLSFLMGLAISILTVLTLILCQIGRVRKRNRVL